MDIAQIKIIKVPKFNAKNGKLIKIESGLDVDFNIKRFFQITAKKNDIRGYHAHKKYYQLMICTAGKMKIFCDDGINKKFFLLKDSNKAILLPPKIWSYQEYLETPTILTVLTNGAFNEKEYIRNYKNFKHLKK